MGKLSTPRLARWIGVGDTSIYWFFRSKEEPFNAPTERAAVMFPGLTPTLTGHSWGSHLRRAPMQPQEATDHYARRLEAELTCQWRPTFP